MEYVIFGLIILFLILVLLLISRLDRQTKSKWRKSAYSLLEMSEPDPEEIMKTIKGLRLYGGRIRRDKEFQQLVSRLLDKLDAIKKKPNS